MAKFEAGHKKIGGRKKGTPNKLGNAVQDMCEKLGANPLEVMVGLLSDPEHKFGAAKELLQYVYPKKKALEITITDLSDDEILAEAERRLRE